ncbi:MAG: hypothetical protein U1F87_16485 [Kiritimatiellia bacterium]
MKLPACLALLVLAALPAAALTSNGNEFALYYSEAKTPAARAELLKDAQDRPHTFRYLQIMTIEYGTTNDTDCVFITAFEPSSLLDVSFMVTAPVSLKILRADPETKPGDAIAITGRITRFDEKRNSILLGETLVRHKDRLSPAVGKELMCEVTPNGVFYSFTGGGKEVNLTYQDRDLLSHQSEILDKQGKKAWSDFLEAELARRKAARAKEPGK